MRRLAVLIAAVAAAPVLAASAQPSFVLYSFRTPSKNIYCL
jgi:hypothetical protein